MAAVMFNGKPLSPDVVVDETWFSDRAFCEQHKVLYISFASYLVSLNNIQVL